MDEQNVTQAVEQTEQAAPTAPESSAEETQAAPENWEEEAILPDDWEKLFPPDGDADKASGDADAPSEESGAQAESGDEKPSGETDAPSGQEPDYKALYEAQQEKAAADKYRAVYNEQMALNGNEALARMIARNECGGKDYPLEDAPETPSASGQSKTDFKASLEEVLKLYPDASEMPGDVMKAFADGTPLKDAYAAFRAKTDAATIADLRKENAALKKAASNRAAAPVRGVKSAAPEKEDPFIKGFDSEW